MHDLSRFQDAFASALAGNGPLEAFLAPDSPAIGLDVYRNTVAKGAADALAANYPTVERLVGDTWFRACARAYVAASPPATPTLSDYGESFPRFLAAFEPARRLPYLAPVARIDRLWLEAHFAAGDLASDRRAKRHRLALHPATRMAWFDLPAPTIWRLNRPPAPPPGEAGWVVDWRAEGIIVARPGGAVASRVLDRGGFAFVEACGHGRTLAASVLAAQTADPAFDLAALLPDLLALGAFAPP